MFTGMRVIHVAPWQNSILPPIIILIYISFVYSRLFFADSSTVVGESIKYHLYGVGALYNQLLQSGELLLWDNQIGGGTSAIGNPFYQQFSPILYPLLLIFKDNFLILERAFYFIHLLIAAYSFYFLIRYLKGGALVGVLGTILFVSSKYFVVMTLGDGTPTDLIYISWIPLVFLTLLISLDRLSIVAAILAGAVFSMFVHEGAGGNTLLVMVMLVIFFCCYTVFGLSLSKFRQSLLKSFRLLVIFVIFITFAFMFSAAKLLPVMEYFNISNRSQHTLEQAEGEIDLKSYKHNYLIPTLTNFFWLDDQNPAIKKTLLMIHYPFYLLIVLSLLMRQTKLVLPLIIAGVVIIIIGATRNIGWDLYAILYNFFPGFKSVRLPPRILFLLWFILPLLATLGLIYLEKLMKRKKLFKLIVPDAVILSIIGILLLAYFGHRQVEKNKWFNYIPSQVNQSLKDLKVGDIDPARVLVSYDGNNYQTNTLPMYEYAAISDSGYYDMVMNIYNDARPYYFDVYGDPVLTEKGFKPFFNEAFKKYAILNVKLLAVSDNLYEKSFTPNSSLLKELKTLPKSDFEPESKIYEVTQIRSRIEFIQSGMLFIGEGSEQDRLNVENVRKIIFNKKFDLSKNTIFFASPYLDDYTLDTLLSFEAILLHNFKVRDQTVGDQLLKQYQFQGGKVINELETLHLNTFDKPSSFKINHISEKPGSLEVNFESDSHGFFVYSNSFYPGWEAYLNGQKIPVYIADSYVKGVVIPEGGLHNLKIFYNPLSFKLGATLSLLAVLITIIYFFYDRKHQLVRGINNG